MNSSIKVVNGMYVIHFLQMLPRNQIIAPRGFITNEYKQAIANAKPFGGRKFNNRSFGGGIGFDYQNDAENALEWAEAQGKTVWSYVVNHSDGKVTWIGKTTVGEAKKLEGEGRMVCNYQNEASYLEMKRNSKQG